MARRKWLAALQERLGLSSEKKEGNGAQEVQRQPGWCRFVPPIQTQRQPSAYQLHREATERQQMQAHSQPKQCHHPPFAPLLGDGPRSDASSDVSLHPGLPFKPVAAPYSSLRRRSAYEKRSLSFEDSVDEPTMPSVYRNPSGNIQASYAPTVTEPCTDPDFDIYPTRSPEPESEPEPVPSALKRTLSNGRDHISKLFRLGRTPSTRQPSRIPIPTNASSLEKYRRLGVGLAGQQNKETEERRKIIEGRSKSLRVDKRLRPSMRKKLDTVNASQTCPPLRARQQPARSAVPESWKNRYGPFSTEDLDAAEGVNEAGQGENRLNLSDLPPTGQSAFAPPTRISEPQTHRRASIHIPTPTPPLRPASYPPRNPRNPRQPLASNSDPQIYNEPTYAPPSPLINSCSSNYTEQTHLDHELPDFRPETPQHDPNAGPAIEAPQPQSQFQSPFLITPRVQKLLTQVDRDTDEFRKNPGAPDVQHRISGTTLAPTPQNERPQADTPDTEVLWRDCAEKGIWQECEERLNRVAQKAGDEERERLRRERERVEMEDKTRAMVLRKARPQEVTIPRQQQRLHKDPPHASYALSAGQHGDPTGPHTSLQETDNCNGRDAAWNNLPTASDHRSSLPRLPQNAAPCTSEEPYRTSTLTRPYTLSDANHPMPVHHSTETFTVPPRTSSMQHTSSSRPPAQPVSYPAPPTHQEQPKDTYQPPPVTAQQQMDLRRTMSSQDPPPPSQDDGHPEPQSPKGSRLSKEPPLQQQQQQMLQLSETRTVISLAASRASSAECSATQ
ncbi:hypothetical protein BU26DRAFT_572389 [Trematosphaeria pertusa]|uniref:Uncharacterized protein n=1 Tax=Trematosphaeria pertusa TaxID=390896 RepID=A0A6A6HS18_9PLEO|nr:uncharacterized protein BU26DRAFT_572389 [Trematosphaeria pertusa]KAF2240777.1 hypothetical protein BU26DRAFT_572389 [Trematosphaeria pertusa]